MWWWHEENQSCGNEKGLKLQHCKRVSGSACSLCLLAGYQRSVLSGIYYI